MLCAKMSNGTSCTIHIAIVQDDDVETPYGNMHVAVQGDRSKPAILTFHDIGLNRKFSL